MITVAFKKIPPTDAIKDHVELRGEKVKKFVPYPVEISVILSHKKPFYATEINTHAGHKHLVAIATSADLYETIDLAFHKLENQLKKLREKNKGHEKAHRAKKARLSLAKRKMTLVSNEM